MTNLPTPAPALRGNLDYRSAYTDNAIRREVRRLITRKGVVRGTGELLLLAGRNAGALAYFSVIRPRFIYRGAPFQYLAGLGPLGRGSRRIPPALRLANVFSKIDSERSVEIPLALAFCRGTRPQNLLEVGNVLSYYANLGAHVIVDKYETIPGVLNIDAANLDVNRKFERIVSVSTVEHIGFDEPEVEPQKPIRTIRRLLELLSDRGRMLITMPIGYNPTIDASLLSGGFPDFRVTALMAVPGSLKWIQVSLSEDLLRRRSVVVLEYPAEA